MRRIIYVCAVMALTICLSAIFFLLGGMQMAVFATPMGLTIALVVKEIIDTL